MQKTDEVKLRRYAADDALALLALFRDTIRRINSRDYDETQVAAWASDEIDPNAWRTRFEGRFAVVAEIDGDVAGFAELEHDGHIDRFYVSADYQRQGVGRSMISAFIGDAERLGIARLFAEVSITARPFFESQGFVVLETQTVVVRGVKFLNYSMERRLVRPTW
jgi:putative acetyltransferase